ncbi:hypothetical protein VNO77_02729 [Canavalia gladiata]|uniref:Uncharacterized protein n=1 Tax=Canavalia gladiata TaxID=3824 RepID=A0AAN9MTJ0_CANGL
MATTSKEGSNRANYPILTWGVCIGCLILSANDELLALASQDADQRSVDVSFKTLLAPYEKSKSLGFGASMVTRSLQLFVSNDEFQVMQCMASFQQNTNPDTTYVKELQIVNDTLVDPETVLFVPEAIRLKARLPGCHIMFLYTYAFYNKSREASSVANWALVPWKGAPERVRTSLCLDPIEPRGVVGELGCLGM